MHSVSSARSATPIVSGSFKQSADMRLGAVARPQPQSQNRLLNANQILRNFWSPEAHPSISILPDGTLSLIGSPFVYGQPISKTN